MPALTPIIRYIAIRIDIRVQSKYTFKIGCSVQNSLQFLFSLRVFFGQEEKGHRTFPYYEEGHKSIDSTWLGGKPSFHHPTHTFNDVWHRGILYCDHGFHSKRSPRETSFTNYTYFTLPNKNTCGTRTNAVPELYKPKDFNSNVETGDKEGNNLMYISTAAPIYPWMKLEGKYIGT